MASFDALPMEIWVLILRNCSMNDIFHISLDSLLLLTLVSDKWRNRIENTPSFWTDIILDDTVEDLMMKIALCLHYSQDAPLSLQLRYSIKSWQTVGQLVMNHRLRIREVVISHPQGHCVRSFRTDVLQALSQLATLPLLTRIVYYRWNVKYPDINQFIEQNPSITEVIGLPLSTHILQRGEHRLQRFSTIENPSNVIYLIKNITLLEEINFLYTVEPPPRQPESQPLSPDLYNQQPHPRWRRLTYHSILEPLPSRLLASLSSYLTYLDITASISIFDEILPILHNCTQLETFRIDLRFWPDSILDFLYKKHSTPSPGHPSVLYYPSRRIHVRRLEIFCDPITDPSEAKILGSLFATLQKIIPSIMELSFSIENFDDALLFHVDGYQYLESLTFSHYTDDSLGLSPYYAQNWRFPTSLLEVRADCHPQEFNTLHSSTVERLWIQCQDETVNGVYNVGQWPALRSLKIENIIEFPHMSSSLHYLHTLIVKPQSSNAITNCCYQLASHPSICPSLVHLKLHGTPEWDILFIMLKRRNSLHLKEVSPIKHLEIPEPPYFLSRAINQLLTGQEPCRPSSYELSWEGNAEILHDGSMYVNLDSGSINLLKASSPGCISCHRALHLCSTQITNTKRSSEVPTISYPSSPEEVLATWPERRDLWALMPKTGRPDSCGRIWDMHIFTNESLDS